MRLKVALGAAALGLTIPLWLSSPPPQPTEKPVQFVYPSDIEKSNYEWHLEATVDFERWTMIAGEVDSNGWVVISVRDTDYRFYRLCGFDKRTLSTQYK